MGMINSSFYIENYLSINSVHLASPAVARGVALGEVMGSMLMLCQYFLRGVFDDEHKKHVANTET